MEQIYPLKEEVIVQYCGMPVCVVFKTGVRRIGILKACLSGKLFMSDELFGGGAAGIDHPKQQNPTFAAAAESPKKNVGNRKRKRVKAAKLRNSSAKHAPGGNNSALLDTYPISLDDIAFLLLLL